MNFNKIFGKNITYNDIKSDQAVYVLKCILRVKAWIFFFFLSETLMELFAKSAIFHSI